MGESGSLLGRFLFRILLFVFIFEPSRAVWLSLPPKGTKCVSEELHNNVVVLTDYIVIPDEPPSQTPTITIKVTSPFGKTIHHRENVTHGQFAFTASEAGNYLACFWADGSPGVGDLSVNVDWKTGIAAKDWDSVARKENIEGLELEFSKLEAVVEEIHDNLLYLKTRELEMRSVSETTNSRVAWFSIMSLGVCIAASVVQILYLKQYFQKKKLI